MDNLEKYTNDLVKKDGIYFSKNQSPVSYPKEGNAFCFQLEKNSFWFNHRNNCIINAVKKYAPESLFFDVGGGNGFVSKGLEEAGISTVLVEPGLQGCVNAQKRGLTNIICSTLQDASFKANFIEAIGLFDVIEHIEDDVNFLNGINGYLTEQGLVFITVPAYNMLWSKEDDKAGHFRRYTLQKLKRVLKKTGYKIEYATYIFSVLPVPVFFSRSIPGRLGLNKRSKKHNGHQANKYIREHQPKKGWTASILDKIWASELNRIKKGKKIPFGGSCFVVARKVG